MASFFPHNTLTKLSEQFDVIIIGAGPAGYPAAAEALSQGLKVAVIEKREAGGTCLNRGCIPTKCLVHSAETLLTARNAAADGVVVEGTPAIDFPAVRRRMDGVVSTLRQGVEGILKGAEVLHGEAKLVGTSPLTVEVDSRILTAPKVIIATGAEPARLPVPGAESAITSDELLKLEHLPQSVAIIGAGVIGMEFASALAAMGVKVSVVEYCPEILPPVDAEVAKRLRMLLKRRGIDFHVGAKVTAVEPGAVVFEAKGKEGRVEAETIVMAVGRRPVIPTGVAEAGVNIERGRIAVDPETLQTNIPGLYAAGDVNGICQLAHAATAQAMRIMGKEQRLTPVPSVVFTIPEVAMVGVLEKDAPEGAQVVKNTFRSNGKALTMGETDGMVKMVTDTDGRLLGGTIMGSHAADLIQELTVAVAEGMTLDALRTIIHPHPTLSEVLL